MAARLGWSRSGSRLPGKEMFASAPDPELRGASLDHPGVSDSAKPRPNALPGIVVDDPQLRHIVDEPIPGWSDPRESRRAVNGVLAVAQSYAVSPSLCFGGFTLADQAFGNRVVVRFTCGQQNGEEASLSIGECGALGTTRAVVGCGAGWAPPDNRP
jgi:hypothetical protein